MEEHLLNKNVPCPKPIGDLEILFLSNRLKEREIEQIADDNKKARELSEADNKKARELSEAHYMKASGQEARDSIINRINFLVGCALVGGCHMYSMEKFELRLGFVNFVNRFWLLFACRGLKKPK